MRIYITSSWWVVRICRINYWCWSSWSRIRSSYNSRSRKWLARIGNAFSYSSPCRAHQRGPSWILHLLYTEWLGVDQTDSKSQWWSIHPYFQALLHENYKKSTLKNIYQWWRVKDILIEKYYGHNVYPNLNQWIIII